MDAIVKPDDGRQALPVHARRWTAADHVYDALEQMVIEGTLPPGDRLTELGLAARLQVSRTPLRQAIEKLVSRRWMRRTASGALHVIEVSEQEIEALYAVRTSLEQLMLLQAAERLTPADIDELREVLARQAAAAKSTDAAKVSRHGEEFHRLLWRLSGNEVGRQFLEEVLQRTTRYRRLSFATPHRFRKGLEEHRRVVAALARGRVEEASSILERHVDESRRYVLQAFRAWRDARSSDVGPSSAATADRKRAARPRSRSAARN
jgi:DNA-binding GntR family transcriptional regulator